MEKAKWLNRFEDKTAPRLTFDGRYGTSTAKDDRHLSTEHLEGRSQDGRKLVKVILQEALRACMVLILLPLIHPFAWVLVLAL